MPALYIGNKNYSSWSLRPWLALRWAGIDFDEHLIRLGTEGYGQGKIAEIQAISPTGRVPALHVDGVVIWDSLAIAEWAAEQVPALWPADARVRAECRATVCEMHSGFAAVRRDLSMNIRRRVVVPSLPDDTRGDLARLETLWSGLHSRFGGPWLFGARTLADAFYAPVATRLRTYGVSLSRPAMAWTSTLFADPDFRAWEAAAEAEPWFIEDTERLYR